MRNANLRWFFCWLLTILIAGYPIMAQQSQAPAPAAQPTTDELLAKDYIELFNVASTWPIPKADLQKIYDERLAQYKSEKQKLEAVIKNSEIQEKDLEKQLQALQDAQYPKGDKNKKKDASKAAAPAPKPMTTQEFRAARQALHCKMYGARYAKTNAALDLLKVGIKFYGNDDPKMFLLSSWPDEKARIEADIAAGEPLGSQRPHANVEDIGMRNICKDCDQNGQAKDMKLGAQAKDEIEKIGGFKYLDQPDVEEYVNRLAQNIKLNSDVKIPLVVRVTDDKKNYANAFALPGGFFYVDKSLLLILNSESELAGIIAHEIGHIAARHGFHMMHKATLVSIAEYIVRYGVMFIPGIGYGLYYLINYGLDFLKLGVLAKFMGISRENEAEADQLAVQWLHKSDYDPLSFVKAFDTIVGVGSKKAMEEMVKSEGNLKINPKDLNPRSASWLSDHPASYDRMLASEKEAMYLAAADKREGRNPQFVVDSDEFHAMQKLVRERDEKKKADAKVKGLDKKAPTLGSANHSKIEAEGCTVDGQVDPNYKPAEKKEVQVPPITAPAANSGDQNPVVQEPPKEDPDRPILKRKAPEEKKDEKKEEKQLRMNFFFPLRLARAF
jgi:Zn-dependent protease with chaperone function